MLSKVEYFGLVVKMNRTKSFKIFINETELNNMYTIWFSFKFNFAKFFKNM